MSSPFDDCMSQVGKKWLWRSLWIIGLFVLLSLVAYRVVIWAGLEPWSVRKLRFALAAHRGEVLIAAIKAYERDRGAAPDSLAALVPHYVAKIPGTGLADYPDFKYERFTDSYYFLMWYDLGSRNGQPMAGLWCYPEGDAEHAILALTINQTGRVVEARVDRMPKAHQTNAFDAQKWRSKEHRIEMARSLPGGYSPPRRRHECGRHAARPPRGLPDSAKLTLGTQNQVLLGLAQLGRVLLLADATVS